MLTHDKLVNVLKSADVFLSDKEEYIFSDEKSDKSGNTHRVYQHNYRGVPVFGHFLRLHFDSEDILKSLSINTIIPSLIVLITHLIPSPLPNPWSFIILTPIDLAIL